MIAMKLDYTFCEQHQIVVTEFNDELAAVSYVAPIAPVMIAELYRYWQRPLALEAVKADDFSQLLTEAFQQTDGTDEAMEDLAKDFDLQKLANDLPQSIELLHSQDDAPVIRLINAVISSALQQKTSDIHFETFEDILSVRFRIDGVLHEELKPPRALSAVIVSRLKIMSKLDIAEKRLPQDGRMALRIGGRAIDVRVSTIPTHHGERLVLRLLDKKSAALDLRHLGMFEHHYKQLSEVIHRPHGIFLVTGPTGSGKTTTLYAALSDLNSVSRNIMTVEDPIEYDLPGVGQTQVNLKADMTFARGLRAILRQDPDIIMIGEIRDAETLTMAIQASLTGHLVLSTLHTNSAIGAITRLRDMGSESYLVASTIIGVAAQRLVRLLCPSCKTPRQASTQEKIMMGVDETADCEIFEPQGCDECNHIGYQGRTGIYELVTVDQTLKQLIHDDASESALFEQARKTSQHIRQDGFSRVLNGTVDLAEVLRVTAEEGL